MGLDLPELDDTDFDELVDEAEQLLPVYSEEWTNYNPSDPGIAILELLAWTTDTFSYQIDAVTDAHRRKYLQLMGAERRPPSPASIHLVLAPPDGTDGTTIPAGTKLAVAEGSGSDLIFETDSDVVLSDASVAGVVTEHDGERTDHTHANDTGGMFYRPFGETPTAGDSMYLGLDADPFDEEPSVSITADFYEANLPDPATHGDEAPRFYPSVDLVWEYCDDYRNPADDDAWAPLSVARDGTNAFYRGGTVTLRAPDDWDASEWDVDDGGLAMGPTGLFWLRVRVANGGYEIPPQLSTVGLNVVEARHRTTVTDERLRRARSDQGPASLTDQRYEFERSPVLDAEIEVDGETWEEVDEFDASGPDDHHYVLEHDAGQIRFGDGVRGAMPAPKAEVVASSYVAGGGAVGNVSASSVWRFLEVNRSIGDGVRLGDLSVTPAGAATGGSDGESLDMAFRRVRRDLQTPYRAVTEGDIHEIATRTPGLRFGRARVLVGDRSGTGRSESSPSITVVVVPYAPSDVSRPEPSEGFLDAVQDHLDRHRLLTDRITVEPPRYVGLNLSVVVRSSRRAAMSNEDEAIESAVESYLDPIHGYDGNGWPFGRTLFKEELYDRLEALDWIDTVLDISLIARGNATVDSDGNVSIGNDSLFYVDEITTDVRLIQRTGGPGGGD